MEKMRKFVLVDPSFDGKRGDKWQYAVAFLESAKRNGYDFYLLGHENSPSVVDEAGQPINQRNIFSYGFYQHGGVAGRHISGPRRRELKTRDARTNAALAALDSQIAAKRNSGDFVAAQRLQQARTTQLESYVASSATLIAEIEKHESPPTPFNRDDFARAMAEQIVDLNLGQGDVLFFHTITQAMMESLSEISAHLPGDITADVDAYFLFHFGAEAPGARTFIDRYHSYSHYETLQLRLASGSCFRRVHLLATNTLLRDELEGFFGVPVGLFDGLTNLKHHLSAVGGEEAFETLRTGAKKSASSRMIDIGVRIADLDDERLEAIRKAAALLRQSGFIPSIRLAYHDGNKAKAFSMAAGLDSFFVLVDTSENDDYVKFLAACNLVLLPYRTEIYKKRVSAVLHDCAVMGISCVVPSDSTLEQGDEFADVFRYSGLEELPGVILFAAVELSRDLQRSEKRLARAHELFASDVISRLTAAMPSPSLTVEKRGPIATVVMPLWGRVGSSYAIEAQMRFLLEQGYFVIQVFALDKAADIMEAIPYFWRMLLENSQQMRGNIQRIAFRTADLDTALLARTANGFDVYVGNIGENELHDEVAGRLAKQSTITLVNHVFNSRLARKIGGGVFILETHDIQSSQMAKWPLRNPVTNQPESYDVLLDRELEEVAAYDFVVNVSNAEHDVLKRANPKSKVVIPFVPFRESKSRFESVGAMSHALNWHECYHSMHKFDLLLVGDSHPANIESALWFINEVFQPHLSHQELSLAIVGRAANKLHDSLGPIGNVYYCGYVDDIADVRNLSRLAILPDQRGSGISIKTLETLAYGSPFVGTSVAFRGLLDFLETPPQLFDHPTEFARRIQELIRNEERLRKLGGTATAIYEKLAGKDKFDAAWVDTLRALRLPLAGN